MMKNISTILIAAGLALGSCNVFAQTSATAPSTGGDKAPATAVAKAPDGDKMPMPSLKIKSLDGTVVDIRDLVGKGKPMVISFWATWCGPCIDELRSVNLIIDSWREKYNADVIAISIDDTRQVAKVAPFVKGEKWDFAVYLDTNRDSFRAFNISNVPYILVVDGEGNIVYKKASASAGEEQILDEELAKLVK